MGDRELARRRPGVDRPAAAVITLLPRGGLYQRRGVCQRGEYAHLHLRRRDSGAGDRRHPNRDWRRSGQCAAAGDAPDKDNPFTSFLALTGITSALNFIMTANGVPALYTTFAQSFADATGFPLLSVIMIQVLGYSTPLLPYQASPIVVAMGLGKVPARAGMQLCLALAAVSYLILLPLDYAWYQLLGKL